MKYTDILDVSVAAGSECTDWVTVLLHDGTSLEMTRNHPVECFSTSEGGRSQGRYIPASEVQAEIDSIVVLKTVLVPVSSVQRTTPDPVPSTSAAPSRDWVNLSVQHPDRHTIFVSHSSEAARGAMAVGTLDFSHGGHRMSVKRSFVAVEDDAGTSEKLSSRRTVSAPDLGLTRDQDLDLEAGFLGDPQDSEVSDSPRRAPMGAFQLLAGLVAGAGGALLSPRGPPAEGPTAAAPSRASSASAGGLASSAGSEKHGGSASTTSASEGKRKGGLRRERQREKLKEKRHG
ncbi:unnamed protein product [Prorocentrum cordatum]|uniref:Uncharacterized protein n=1 Tax=Prorocentrum cordatum TaxID=2364126 RepID=A0ABN9S9S8_9DINO|nr:unnamed protein product [Polarella glacialis]